MRSGHEHDHLLAKNRQRWPPLSLVFKGQDTEDITVKWPIHSCCSKTEFDLLHLIPTNWRRMGWILFSLIINLCICSVRFDFSEAKLGRSARTLATDRAVEWLEWVHLLSSSFCLSITIKTSAQHLTVWCVGHHFFGSLTITFAIKVKVGTAFFRPRKERKGNKG